MARVLLLMGSGETTPTMVATHQRVLRAAGDGPRMLIDTPYGFQENADELTERIGHYFEHNVGHPIETLSMREASSLGQVEAEVLARRVAEAAWVFAGPGSPTYFARQLLATPIPEQLRTRLMDPGRPSVTVLASAAACTAGRLTIPVYEIYKVGEPPAWKEGLDLLRPIGLDAIVVPHFDNAEGGTHDTSCCYIGERRLRALEVQLEPSTWVLGIDEHTAAVIDLDAREMRVEGRGRVVVRVRGAEHALLSGDVLTFDELLRTVASLGATLPEAPSSRVPPAEVGGDRTAFLEAVERGDLLGAAEVTAGLVSTAVQIEDDVRVAVVRQIAALAGIAQAGLHEHRQLVAPHVEALLGLRRTAREERRYADADAIRDVLLAAGIEVRDVGDGTSWGFSDPLDGALADALGGVRDGDGPTGD